METAEQLLARVAETYARASTYMDEGTHTTVSITERGPFERSTSRSTFKTFFRRDGRFLLEYCEAPFLHSAVWTDAEGNWNWSVPGPTEKTAEARELAQGAIHAVCGGAASTTTRLLSPESAKRPVLPVRDLSIFEPAEEVQGRACLVVTGKNWRGQEQVVWIDRELALVLKWEAGHVFDHAHFAAEAMNIRAQLDQLPGDHKDRPMMQEMLARWATRERPDFRTESATIWKPRINVTIPDAAFVFTPLT